MEERNLGANAATPRLDHVDGRAFELHVSACRPFVVRDVTRTWPHREWTPEFLVGELGDLEAQVYDDGFELQDIVPLREYVERHIGGEPDAVVPYVRWYSRFKEVGDTPFPWADEAFARLSSRWQSPGFFPRSAFAWPYCRPPEELDPVVDRFPGRGLFISGKGASTRLHIDPWASDALLIQVHGRKRWTLYGPEQDDRLRRGDRVVDLVDPDLNAFPRFPRARPDHVFETGPGDAVYVPAGWFHDVTTLSDSVALTWNFVHRASLPRFIAYLRGEGRADDEVVSFFLPAALRGRPVDEVIAFLEEELA